MANYTPNADNAALPVVILEDGDAVTAGVTNSQDQQVADMALAAMCETTFVVADGNFVVPANAEVVDILMIGGGAGGTGSSGDNGGGGGGAGQSVRARFGASIAGLTLSCTIGSGGSGGSSSPSTPGSSGGDTTVSGTGVELVAEGAPTSGTGTNGGDGGTSAITPASGGSTNQDGGNAAIAQDGAAGGGGGNLANNNSGAGGWSYGRGGLARTGGGLSGDPGRGYGAGGGGASSPSGQGCGGGGGGGIGETVRAGAGSDASGGDGADGVVIIRVWRRAS